MVEKESATLTFRQKEAVEHSSGPLLILAGAGTGKTTTITAKIAYDYEHGFKETNDPEVCRECGFRLYCDGINL